MTTLEKRETEESLMRKVDYNTQLTETISNTLKEVRIQTQLTNGRVSSLENWKYFITGGLAIITILILPILFRLIK